MSAADGSRPGSEPSSSVDWALAARLGGRWAGPGPDVPADEVAAMVEGLRRDAARSTALVSEFTGLVPPADGPQAPVLVVDRARWVEANTQSFEQLLTPFAERLAAGAAGAGQSLPRPLQAISDAGAAVGSRLTATEVAAVLAFLSSRVLGQFDPFAPRDVAPAGRLLLVAPNVQQIGTQIGADLDDFRLWVCLHEETHRVQFTAVPWLRDHLRGEVDALSQSVDPASLLDGMSERLAGVVRSVRAGRADDAEASGAGGSIVDLVSTPEQREIIDRLTGVMSLLEGHADVVMDGVGPGVIPSVRRIRRSFEQRRDGVGFWDRALRRLLGMDAKLAQYRDGAGFVRGAIDAVGMEGFNAVWSEPAHLPSRSEIADPSAWVRRVHG